MKTKTATEQNNTLATMTERANKAHAAANAALTERAEADRALMAAIDADIARRRKAERAARDAAEEAAAKPVDSGDMALLFSAGGIVSPRIIGNLRAGVSVLFGSPRGWFTYDTNTMAPAAGALRELLLRLNRLAPVVAQVEAITAPVRQVVDAGARLARLREIELLDAIEATGVRPTLARYDLDAGITGRLYLSDPNVFRIGPKHRDMRVTIDGTPYAHTEHLERERGIALMPVMAPEYSGRAERTRTAAENAARRKALQECLERQYAEALDALRAAVAACG